MMTQENMLARYRILHELGRGAIGAVYAARDRETGGVVALKRLDPAFLSKSDANFTDRFVKHARSARLLRHRNIVTIHDAGEVGGTVYVAMEMLEGESLRNILDAGPLRIARAIQIARDVACGLAYAHLEGVVHGGLKPSNVIVSRSGVVKITDFGIGELGQAALLSGARAGSLSYLSPEQVRGERVDHRCDIFSLGALFYEMLAHRAPFGGDAAKEIMENILHAKPPLPSELNPHVPRALDGIVSSMLAGQPAARMPGVPILLRDLQGLEEGLGLGSGPNAGTDEPSASVPPAGPEPRLRTPDPDRFRDRAPMQDAPGVAQHGEAREASGSRTRADSSAAEERQHRDRITDGEAFDYQKAIAMMERESRRERSSGSRAPIFAALAIMVAVLGIGVAGFTHYAPGSSDRGIVAPVRDLALAWLAGRSHMQEAPATSPKPLAPEPGPLAQKESLVARAPEQPAERSIAARRMQEAPAPARMASRPIAPAPVANATNEPATAPVAPDASPPSAVSDEQAEQESSGTSSVENPLPPKPAATEPTLLAQTGSSAVGASEQPASAGTAPPRALPRAKQQTAEVPQQQRGGTARVILSVSPRGAIYIDGKHHGTTPPITTVDLEPGMHRIEVRSGSRRPYLTYMMVQAGDVRRIRYDFDTSRAVYPGKSVSWQKSKRAAR